MKGPFKTGEAEAAAGRVIVSDNHHQEVSENDILLALSNDITTVTSIKDILNIIHPKLKFLFNTDDVFICFLDASSQTLLPVLRVGGVGRIKHPDFERIVNGSFPIHDGFAGLVIRSKIPMIFDIDNLVSLPNPTESMKLYKKTGLSQAISVALSEGGHVIGVLTIFSENKHFFTSHHRKLISDVAKHISIVVANILAREALKKKEQQNEILLSLSNEIARIRGKDDMLHIIRNIIKQHINFDDSFILRYNKDNKTFKAYIYHAEQGRSGSPEFESQLDVEYPKYNGLSDSHTPVVQDVETLLAAGTDQVSFIHRAGIKEFVSIKLIEGNQLIGLFILLSERRNAFKPEDLSLLQSLSYQISIATANIIANEEIVKREQEKSVLLSLSNKIAAVKNKNELLDLLSTKLRELFSITDFAITLLNEDGQTHSPYMVDAKDEIKNDVDFGKVINLIYRTNDGVFNNIIDATEPVRMQVDELAKNDEASEYVSFWKKMGILEITGMPVRVGQTNLGCFILLHNTRSNNDISANLLKGVCSQISVAISNIMAIEEIQHREQEKSRLLKFSNALASVRDKEGLAKILKQQLKELFGIDDYVIHALSDDKKTHRPILYDSEANFVKDPEFQKLVNTNISEGRFNAILNAMDLVSFDIEEWFGAPQTGATRDTARYAGKKWMAGVAIRLGSENIGVMNFRQDGISQFAFQKPLFKSICSQIAIAVSNITANEKVNQQLVEIQKYRQQLEEEKIYLKEEIESSQNYTEIIGESTEIKKIFRMVTQVAYSDSTVLLLGETGTGKELIARAIHNSSTRKNKLMVKVNCAALPATLIESELFGHERGSFTGAVERRIGKFELAANGTLFLDEIGEMPLDLQVKLLRALQEKEIERVGGKTIIKTDVRIIAATNRNLERLMEEGKFRSDLYYRLNIFPITLPPLRDRREDIRELALYFIVRCAKKAGKKINTISNKALNELIEYNWPGNIRELEHLIERSVLLANGDTIKEVHLPQAKSSLSQTTIIKGPDIKTIEENEREHILDILKHTKGRIGGLGGAAELLGVPTSTLNSKIQRLGIKRGYSA